MLQKTQHNCFSIHLTITAAIFCSVWHRTTTQMQFSFQKTEKMYSSESGRKQNKNSATAETAERGVAIAENFL